MSHCVGRSVGWSVGPSVTLSFFCVFKQFEGRKVRPTDGLTNTVTYRVACTRLMAIGLAFFVFPYIEKYVLAMVGGCRRRWWPWDFFVAMWAVHSHAHDSAPSHAPSFRQTVTKSLGPGRLILLLCFFIFPFRFVYNWCITPDLLKNRS